MEKCRSVRLVNVQPQRSIIIDTHGGIQDIIGIMSAIQMARMHDKEIIGITCVNGRRNVHDAASDALLAIKLCNASIPIYLGATQTIMMKKRFPKTLNQSNKFQFIDKIKHEVLKQQDFKLIQPIMAPRFIAEQAQKLKESLAIITFGPLTNIAIAFHIQYSVKEVGMISIHGGQYTGVGNVLGEYSAQANFHFDPQAAHIVVKNFSKNVYIVPIERTLDICWKKTLLEVAQVPCVDNYKSKLLERLAKYEVTCIGPLLAVFPVLSKKSLKKYFDVYAELSMQGRMVQGLLAINWFRLDLKDGQQEPNIKICAEYDTEAMKIQLKKSWCGIKPHQFKI